VPVDGRRACNWHLGNLDEEVTPLSPGKQATATIKKPGTYTCHCELHDYMKGTIKAT
jgi:plastocyanin